MFDLFRKLVQEKGDSSSLNEPQKLMYENRNLKSSSVQADKKPMTSNMRQFIFVFVFLGLVACDTKSQIQFKGDRLTTAQPVGTQLGQSQAGVFRRKTATGYNVDVSLGAGANLIRRQTASGSKIQLNIIGQAAP